MIRLSSTPIDPAALVDHVTSAAGGAGAIASFVGLVRGERDGEAVTQLWLDYHERLTPASLDAIAADVRYRFAVLDLTIIHRIGAVAVGEPIVFVAAAALHRRAALDAVDYAMDRLKTDAILWKRETRSDGAFWIDPTADDRSARARWDPVDGQ